MKTLTLNLPEEVNEKEVKMAVAAILFDKAILSSGQAAEFVGISKREFLENVGKFGVSIFGESAEDLKIPFNE
jgi:predicted HTH domain antitoxin